MWGKGNRHMLLVGMAMDTATAESSMEALKKRKPELQYDPATPLLGIYPKETQTLIWKDTCTPNVQSSTLYNN